MSRFNRKGPEGQGPKTGRGLGRCNRTHKSADAQSDSGSGCDRKRRQHKRQNTRGYRLGEKIQHENKE